MRTNIDIDDELMTSAMKMLGTSTKKETVAEALRYAIRWKKAQSIRDLRGKVEFWDGYEEELRASRGWSVEEPVSDAA